MKRRLRSTTDCIQPLLGLILIGFVHASSPYDALSSAAASIGAINNGANLESTASTSTAKPPPNQAPLALPSSPWHPKQTLDPQGRGTSTAATFTNNSNELPPNDSQSPPPFSHHRHNHHTHHPLSPVRRRRRRSPLWTIPFVASAASFVSFRRTSRIFHGLVQWMSSNTWIPKTFKELNLQANVVTQVINGPVITSISVLFASLVSMTISSLYQRQADIRLCLTNEIQALQILHTLLVPVTITSLQHQQQQHQQQQLHAPTIMTPEERHLAQAQDYLHQYIQYFAEEINSRGMKRPSNSNGNTNGGEEDEDEEVDQPPPPLLALLAWCQQEPIVAVQETQQGQAPPSPPPSPFTTASSSLLYANVSDWVCRLWSERSHRHLAWASTFPMVHYITLTFLAVGIGIAFLVATDQSTSIFLEGLPVRILWSILMGSFTALAVVCYDLSAPFGGAYQVTTATMI